MPKVHHHRTHHPVGQGLFHSGVIKIGTKEFRYVYDSGGGKRAVAAQVRAYVRELKRWSRRHLDAVFLSHFHQDHYNGLIHFAKAKVSIGRIFVPLMNGPIDRLLAVAAEIGHLDDAQKQFLIGGIDSFVESLGFRERMEITEVYPGRRDTPSSTDFPMDQPDSSEPTLDLSLVFAPESRAGREAVPGRTMDDRRVLALNSASSGDIWEFVLHVDEEILEKKARFAEELRKGLIKLGVLSQGDSLEKWLAFPQNVMNLIECARMRKVVRDAYSVVSKGLNATSLSLYSGPFNRSTLERTLTVRQGRHGWRYSRNRSAPVSWLGTGDRNLAESDVVLRFAQHFNGRLRGLATFTMPHHGSSRDLSPEIIGRIEAVIAIASFGIKNKYRHPGDRAMSAAMAAGMWLARVTERTAPLKECVRVTYS